VTETEPVLSAEAERFERRLTEEISGVRLEMHAGFAAVRQEMRDDFASVRREMHDGLAAVRQEMGAMRADILKWSFLFWIGQVAAITALISFMLRAGRP